MAQPGASYTADASLPTSRPLAGFEKKSILEAYILAVSPLGLLGAHHFYLGRYYWGIVYFFTLGLMGCGYLIDWFRVPFLVRDYNSRERTANGCVEKKTVSDAYTMWFPFGLIGFHQYYLGNYAWGAVYTCTLGLFGIGWLIDLFRIPSLVKTSNERMQSNVYYDQEKNLCLAYVLALTTGYLGGHHYYLNRPIWGVLYTFTLGLMGMGWVYDWIRMPWLVQRANHEVKGQRSTKTKTVDDAYILWLPWGFLGFHHFYLDRPLWGFLYFFTLGLLGIGWLVDLFRIPSLVKSVNKKNEERERIFIETLSRQPQVPPCQQIAYVNQGYQTYGMANPSAYTPTCQPGPYPQQVIAYPNNVGSGAPYYPQAGYPSYPDAMQPPPYSPREAGTDGQEAGILPPKTNV
ncbi:uncharacterized protein LOC131941724 isoform X2 [Physella acuta]|nr:uncharacterized protein LOC131941724 isoform X2 [Physella acuta]